MSTERLHRFDPTAVIFSALGSFWWRFVAFFVCCWIGHYAGVSAHQAGHSIDRFLRHGWDLELEQYPLWVPVTWLWYLVDGCANPLGLIQLFILAGAFLILRLSEDRFYSAFCIVLITQPIHSFLVSLQNSQLEAMDWVCALILLVTWETGVGALYWWFRRQME